MHPLHISTCRLVFNGSWISCFWVDCRLYLRPVKTSPRLSVRLCSSPTLVPVHGWFSDLCRQRITLMSKPLGAGSPWFRPSAKRLGIRTLPLLRTKAKGQWRIIIQSLHSTVASITTSKVPLVPSSGTVEFIAKDIDQRLTTSSSHGSISQEVDAS